MAHKRQTAAWASFTMIAFMCVPTVYAQSNARANGTPAGKAEQTLARAAEQGKYAFLMFYKTVDSPTRAMAGALKNGLADKANRATFAYVRAGDAAERSIVAKYGLSRAPMPLTLVVAPNGAMTAIMPRKLTKADIDDAFVTPTMMVTMKSLQSGKIVLVTAQGSASTVQPRVLKSFQSDPHFKNRLSTVSMRVADPKEAKFVKQMQLDPAGSATHVVLIAPPGVLVGKFSANATKDEIAAALAKAGKCCDDPNCKHNK